MTAGQLKVYLVPLLALTLGGCALSRMRVEEFGEALGGNAGLAGATFGAGGVRQTEAGTPGRIGSGGEQLLIGGTSSAGRGSLGGAAGTANQGGAGTSSTDPCTTPLGIAIIGGPGRWGKGSDTEFPDWLRSSSAGSAKVDNYPARATITAEFLSPYSVVVLAALADDSNQGPFWSFDATERTALKDWVETTGGGLIALSGYSKNAAEIVPTNQLLAFTGISYLSDVTQGNPTADSTLASCAEASPIADWYATNPTTEGLRRGVNWIGIDSGRSIQDPQNDSSLALALGNGAASALVWRLCGRGRVLAFTDEWITYVSLWNGSANANTTNPQCAGHLPQDLYQTPQFWYNMIRWVAPTAACFKIVDAHQAVTLW